MLRSPPARSSFACVRNPQPDGSSMRVKLGYCVVLTLFWISSKGCAPHYWCRWSEVESRAGRLGCSPSPANIAPKWSATSQHPEVTREPTNDVVVLRAIIARVIELSFNTKICRFSSTSARQSAKGYWAPPAIGVSRAAFALSSLSCLGNPYEELSAL
jgi:hypothetical protein